MPATVTVPSPGEILSNPTYRRVIGIALLFVAFVVWPQVFGVGPLSTVSPVNPIGMIYDASSKMVHLSFTVSQANVGSSVSAQFRLNDPNVYADPVTVSAEVTRSKVYYDYVRSGESVGYAACYSSDGSVDVGNLKGDNDLARAVRAAYDAFVSRYGDPENVFGHGNYKVIIDDAHFEGGFLMFGGRAVAHIRVCGIVPDRYYIYDYSGSDLHTCFKVHLLTQSGKSAASSSELCNVIGASSSVASSRSSLVSDGVRVGYVTYQGQLQGQSSGVLRPSAVKVLLDRFATENGDYATGIYLVSPATAATLTSARTYLADLRSNLTNLRTESCGSGAYDVKDAAYSALRSEAPAVADAAVVVRWGDYSCDVSPSPDSVYNDVRLVQSSVKSLLQYPVSSAGFEYNVSLPKSVTLAKDVSGEESTFANHLFTIDLSAKFVGLTYRRAHPRILSATPDGECTDTQCTLAVRLKNDTDSPYEAGPVTVTVMGKYIYAQRVVSLDSPGQEKVVRISAVPDGVTQDVSDDVTVTAYAAHPYDPVKDVYHITLSIKKTPTCTIQSPQCYYDTGKGLWYYVSCPSLYSSPQKHYCAEGQGCQDGVGCVDDVVKAVRCVDSRTYEVQYQFAGTTTGVCESGYVCDANVAAALKVPPCVPQQDYCKLHPEDPQCGGHPVKVKIHVSEYRPSVKDIATGLALIGVALLVMP